MTPADLRSARKTLGLSAKGLAEALRLGKDGGRTVRRWEAGATPISGPASVAVELMLQITSLSRVPRSQDIPVDPQTVPNMYTNIGQSEE